MQQTPMPFVGNSKLMIWNGSIIELNSVDVSDGTLPVGGTWRMVGMPVIEGSNWSFPPPCDELEAKTVQATWELEGHCSGVWTNNITVSALVQHLTHKFLTRVFSFVRACRTNSTPRCTTTSACLSI